MRLLLADANPEVRTALRLVIEHKAGLQVTAEAQDTLHLMTQVASACPDVVLVDAELPGLQLPRRNIRSSLGELFQVLRSICPGLRIIALSSQPTIKNACLQASADAFICKSDPPDALLALLDSVIHSNPG